MNGPTHFLNMGRFQPVSRVCSGYRDDVQVLLFTEDCGKLNRPRRERTRLQGEAMISVLAQERLLGAALGSVFAGIVVYEQRKSIYRLISENQNQHEAQSQMTEPIFAKKSSSNCAHIWNKAVDQTLGPVIASLSSRKW